MATPMTAAQVIAQLKKWRIAYKEPFSDWETHNRGNRGNGWGPVNGFIWHHTGGDDTSMSFLYNGTTALPGPLCQFSIDPQGIVNLIGWGRANHAGGGDPAVLNHVINEDYSGQLTPHYGEGDAGAYDGNGRFYGVEIVYSGSHGMTKAQYTAALKLSAAILDFHGWTEKSAIGHYEWSNQKWDPGYAPGKHMDMSAVRADIKATIAAGPTGGSVSVNTPDKTQVYKDVFESDVAEPPTGHATDANPKWWAINILRGAYSQAEAARIAAEENNAILKKIAAKLGVEL